MSWIKPFFFNMTTNIFYGNSTVAECVRSLDKLLNQQEWVSTKDVWDDLDYDSKSGKFQKTYEKALKKARALIKETLAQRGLQIRSKVDDTDKRQIHISWPKGVNDPLKDLRRAANVQKGLDVHKALKITYSPGYKREEEHIFHPQYACYYNNRHFVFGEYDDGTQNDWEYTILPMDRIISAEIVDGIPYKKRDKGYYINELSHRIGVSPNNPDPTIYKVIIETYDLITHMRIVTKPIHWSQKEIIRYADDKHGQIQIEVQLNNELRAVLLSFGDAIEVISPTVLRQRMASVAEGLNHRYTASE